MAKIVDYNNCVILTKDAENAANDLMVDIVDIIDNVDIEDSIAHIEDMKTNCNVMMRLRGVETALSTPA